MKKIISATLDKIRKNRFFNSIMMLLSTVGVDRFFRIVLFKWYEKNPTESMKRSYRYFESCKDDIDNILSWLSDDKSRQIWKGMIELRETMRYSLHPGRELPQYFVDDIITYGNHEVFVDCGGYDGMTSVEFIRHLKNRGGGYDKIVIYEPDKANMNLLNRNIQNIDRVCVFQKGVWNKTTEIGFCTAQDMTSKVIEEDSPEFSASNDTVQVVAMDDVQECQNATFIKMDLEGAELMALKGAENIIRANKPKLAICIYHSDADMVEIIKYIHQLVPEYKLYVRQHTDTIIETVVYAVL